MKIKSPLFLKYLLIFIGVLLATNIAATILMLVLTGFNLIALPDIIFQDEAPFALGFALRMGIVSFSIGAVFIFIATRIVVKPISKISEAAKKVAKGDLSVRVAHKKHSHDEVSELADNFNLMIEELSRNEYLHKDFVSNVSHEFKTPISAIRGYAEMLASPSLKDEKRIEYANVIEIQSARLAKLSSDLLRLSELENESISLKKDSFSLDEQIRDSVLLLQTEWEQKELNIELDLDEVRFVGDIALLYQAWVNLISNAVKYSNIGGNIKIKLRQSDVITVSISDNGIGMTDEQVSRVFERFYKADETRNSSGTGLGLSIVKRIIELHGGSIEVESEVGYGSCFMVRL